MIECDLFPPIATGTLEAWVAVTSADRKAVEKLLPDRCELAPPPNTMPGTHPLVILAGQQDDVRPRINPEFRASYLEAGVIIPWVRCADVDESNSSLFRTSLYLNQYLPTMLGRLLGLRKTLATIARDHMTMHVETSDDGQIFDASFRPTRSYQACADVPCFDLVQQIFGQRHVGHAMNSDHLPVLCVGCHLNLSDAYARPVTADFKIGSHFCGAISGEFGVPPVRDGCFGAFQLRADWTMQMVHMP